MSDRESDAIDEELTAYLDGELTPQESAALEQRLVEDEFLRTRLAELRKAYDLLDELPETPHSKNFTQTTIEMVIADIKRSGTRDAVDSKQSAQVQSSVDWSRRWFTFPYALVPLAVSLLIFHSLGFLHRHTGPHVSLGHWTWRRTFRGCMILMSCKYCRN
ncbi:MAG: anti-sigma factor family protein [Pirellula sp.]